jgi:predicted dehydrogenase
MAKPVRLGVVGCGGFGLFALQHFTQYPNIELVGMAETHREAAFAAAKRFGIPDPVSLEEMCGRKDVDLVYISTPPFLHHEQAMTALRAGKHVICEKPLAMNMEQAEEMIDLATEKDLLMVTNLMQRYNPKFESVARVLAEGVLGEFLHGYFNNYANDEGLHANHWFWDRSKSGGIFIEHGVHFFDLFQGWLGAGRVESAEWCYRPGTDIIDQVQCAVRYGEYSHVNFYHGFTQPGRMDRQEWQFLFERGDVTLYEWVPVVARIRCAVDEAQTRRLMEIFPGSRLDVTSNYGGQDRKASGRHKELDIYQLVDITYGLETKKMHLYGELLRAMIADQVAWIRDRNHERKITESNGYDSLAMACHATELAETSLQPQPTDLDL